VIKKKKKKRRTRSVLSPEHRQAFFQNLERERERERERGDRASWLREIFARSLNSLRPLHCCRFLDPNCRRFPLSKSIHYFTILFVLSFLLSFFLDGGEFHRRRLPLLLCSCVPAIIVDVQGIPASKHDASSQAFLAL
jgi:hypothetical protein